MTSTLPTNLNIIVLHGKSPSGKSETVLKAVELLLENGYSVKAKYSSESISDNICCVIEKNNKLVGITTRGDDVSHLKKDFESLGYLCDLYICCSRSKGRTMAFLGGLSQDGIQLHLEKSTLSCNRIPASLPIEELKNSIDNCQAIEIVKIVLSVIEKI